MLTSGIVCDVSASRRRDFGSGHLASLLDPTGRLVLSQPESSLSGTGRMNNMGED
jgi:hypothetical protein